MSPGQARGRMKGELLAWAGELRREAQTRNRKFADYPDLKVLNRTLESPLDETGMHRAAWQMVGECAMRMLNSPQGRSLSVAAVVDPLLQSSALSRKDVREVLRAWDFESRTMENGPFWTFGDLACAAAAERLSAVFEEAPTQVKCGVKSHSAWRLAAVAAAANKDDASGCALMSMGALLRPYMGQSNELFSGAVKSALKSLPSAPSPASP